MIPFAHGLHHRGGSGTGDSKGHSSVVHIRTGDIEFDGRDAVECIDAGGTLGIIVG